MHKKIYVSSLSAEGFRDIVQQSQSPKYVHNKHNSVLRYCIDLDSYPAKLSLSYAHVKQQQTNNTVIFWFISYKFLNFY